MSCRLNGIVLYGPSANAENNVSTTFDCSMLKLANAFRILVSPSVSVLKTRVEIWSDKNPVRGISAFESSDETYPASIGVNESRRTQDSI